MSRAFRCFTLVRIEGFASFTRAGTGQEVPGEEELAAWQAWDDFRKCCDFNMLTGMTCLVWKLLNGLADQD